MVVLQIDAERVIVFPFKNQTPIALDVDAMALWLALKAVEIEARQIQMIQVGRGVQNIYSTGQRSIRSPLIPRISPLRK